MLKEKTFREDLYYRLSAFPVNLPPLRTRKGDIPLIAESFLNQIDEGESQIPLSPEVIEKLLSYDYPGNIRELRNIIERAVILAACSPIMPDFIVFEHEQDDHVADDQTVTGAPDHYRPFTRRTGSSRLSREDVLEAIEKCGGHRSQAAQLLGVSERTIYRHLKS